MAWLRGHGDLRAERVEIAELILADLKFKGARPGFEFVRGRNPGVAVAEIKQSGVIRLANFFAPFSVAPFDLQPDVDIGERRGGHHHAKTLTGNVDDRSAVHVGDGENVERVVVFADGWV
jgi:hypothetical protein